MKARPPTGSFQGAASLLLLGALAAAAQTTYQAEIESRQSRVSEIDRELRQLNEEISVQEGRIQDFLIIFEQIQKVAAAAGNREPMELDPGIRQLAQARREPGSREIVDPDGWMAKLASAAAHHPLFESDREEAAVRQWEGALATSVFTFRSGNELIQTYSLLKEKLSDSQLGRVELACHKRKRLFEERERLAREIAALKGGANGAATAAAILGNWRLTTQNNGSVVEVVRNPNTGAFAGVLRECRLQHFSPNATVFVVEPLPEKGGALFSGKEFGYSNDGLPVISPLNLSVAGETMTYRTPNETLQWQRFVPWGEQRSPLGQPPPDPGGFEAFNDF